jgi:hypothetical protein
MNQSLSELTAEWWQHYTDNDKKRSKQPVFFVVGKMREIPEQNKITTRHFCIPRGKPILMPVMNWLSVDLHHDKTESELEQLAREKMDVVSNMDISLDGTPIPHNNIHRVKSPFFMLDGKCKAISDGYWVFFKPDTYPWNGSGGMNRHIIKSFGCCSSGKTQIKIDYVLDII